MSNFELFFFFLKISSTTFGGGIVIVGIIRLAMEQRKDISEEELADLLGLAAAVPGPIAVSSAYLIGRYYRGLTGSIIAVLGAILPPFLAILLISPFILRNPDNPILLGFFKGVLAGVAAMIANVVFDDIRKTLVKDKKNILPYLLVLGLIGVLHINPLLAVASGLILQRLMQWIY